MSETMTRSIKVWDLPTRLFHWTLVLLVLLSFLSGEFGGMDFVMPKGLPGGGNIVDNLTVHMYSGLAILTLVIFRVVWGLVGSTTARFSSFVRGPGAAIEYLRGLNGRGPTAFIAGHNPAGAGMVVAVLVLLLAQAGTGLFLKQEDDFFSFTAPLNSLVSDAAAKTLMRVHDINWKLIELLVILHILANLFYLIVKHENLIGAMFTGRRPLPPGTEAPALKFAPSIVAAILLVLAAAAVWGITKLG